MICFHISVLLHDYVEVEWTKAEKLMISECGAPIILPWDEYAPYDDWI